MDAATGASLWGSFLCEAIGYNDPCSVSAVAADGCGAYIATTNAILMLPPNTNSLSGIAVPVAGWATKTPNRLVVDEGFVYWTDSSGYIGKAPLP